jgi:hypothetical protein
MRSRSPILGFFRPRLCVRQVDGAVTLARPQGVDHRIRHVHGLVGPDPNHADDARAQLHVMPLQLDPGEAVAEKVRLPDVYAAAEAMPALPYARQVHFEAELPEEMRRHSLAVRPQLRRRRQL